MRRLAATSALAGILSLVSGCLTTDRDNNGGTKDTAVDELDGSVDASADAAADEPDGSVDTSVDTGACVTSECSTDGECDDEDDCTADSCNGCKCLNVPVPGCHDCPGGCPSPSVCMKSQCIAGKCESDPVSDGTDCGDCHTCQSGLCVPPDEYCQIDSDCDDTDPCTNDWCDGCTCAHEENACECKTADACGDTTDPCVEHDCVGGECVDKHKCCTPDGVVDIGSIEGPGWAKIEAKVDAHWDDVSCAGVDCADGTCCSGCKASLAFEDGNASLPVEDAEWECGLTTCDDVEECAPAFYTVGYWAWGEVKKTTATSDDLDDGLMIDVEGWCLQTRPAGLPGSYKGMMDFDDSELAAQIKIHISHSSSGWEIVVEPFENSMKLTTETVFDGDITVGDGKLDFDVNFFGKTVDVSFDLTSDKNTLVGTFTYKVVQLQTGTIELERLPADDN